MKAVGAALLLAGVAIALFLSLWLGAVLAIVGIALLIFAPKSTEPSVPRDLEAENQAAIERAIHGK